MEYVGQISAGVSLDSWIFRALQEPIYVVLNDGDTWATKKKTLTLIIVRLIS